MKKKLNLRIILLTLSIAAAFVVVGFSAPKQSADCATETLEECTKSGESDTKMSLENLSQQFFSSF